MSGCQLVPLPGTQQDQHSKLGCSTGLSTPLPDNHERHQSHHNYPPPHPTPPSTALAPANSPTDALLAFHSFRSSDTDHSPSFHSLVHAPGSPSHTATSIRSSRSRLLTSEHKAWYRLEQSQTIQPNPVDRVRLSLAFTQRRAALFPDFALLHARLCDFEVAIGTVAL